MIRRAFLLLTIVGCATSAWAQSPAPAAAADPSVVFIPRYAFHVGAEHLSGTDPAFVWDADFGGEVDVLGYRGGGRATFVANYEVIMGEEFRAFDPTQGNYILAGSASAVVSGYEIAGVFYHQSRHLADRPKRPAVAWNMVGGRVQRTFTVDKARVEARADVRGVIQKAFVDYTWELDAGVRSDVPIRPWFGVLMMADVRHLGVDGSQPRGGQTGYRAEGGVRVQGRAGAIELYLAGERRIDPYPLSFGTVNWFIAGFRLLSR